jgi:hypothetical protein
VSERLGRLLGGRFKKEDLEKVDLEKVNLEEVDLEMIGLGITCIMHEVENVS